MKAFSLILVSFLFLQSANAQDVVNASDLKLSEIMKGNEFIGHQPSNIRWANDGKSILFDWNPENEPGSKTFQHR